MAIPVFTPPKNPSVEYLEPFSPQVSTSRFNKGYDLVQQFGLHQLRQASATWGLLGEDEKDEIESFFIHLPNQIGPFEWKTPEKVASPLRAPIVVDEVPGGAIGATEYFIQFTWHNTTKDPGETKPSIETTFTTTANNFLRVTVPVFPLRVEGWRLYVGFTTGNEGLISTITASRTFTQSAVFTPGAAPPAANTLQVSKIFLLQGAVPKAQRQGDSWRMTVNLQEQIFAQS